MTGPVYQRVGTGSKKYQGRVPSIVALLTSHAKSHYKAQKNVMHADVPPPPPHVPKCLMDSHPGSEKEYWQQKRFSPVSQEIHKVMQEEKNPSLYDSDNPFQVRPLDDLTESSVQEKIDLINKERGYGFSYHLSPPTTTTKHLSRPSALKLPPPPQIPLPPVPETFNPSVAGPSTMSNLYQPGPHTIPDGNSSPQDNGRKGYKAQRVSESVSFANPYVRQMDYPPTSKSGEGTTVLNTPFSEKQRRESTSLFLPPEDFVKPKPINKQKLSAVLVLSMFVVALLIFYLIYFL